MRAQSSPGLLALLRRPDRDIARLDELCGFAPHEGPVEDLVFWFVRLVEWLRPDAKSAATRVRFLRAQLDVHPEYRENVSRAVSSLARLVDVEHFLVYGGIPREFHFLGAVKEWLGARVLPRACASNDGAQIVRLAFTLGDAAWVRSSGLLPLLRDVLDPELAGPLGGAVDNALLDVTHQIVAQAHAPRVRTLSRTDRPPFRGLYETVTAFVAEPGSEARFRALTGRVRQCHAAIDAHRAELADRGADLNTTFQLARIGQQLERLTTLAELRHAKTDDDVLARTGAALVHRITRSGAGIFRRSADLLVQNLVDTAADVGRHYLGDARDSWWAAFRAGAGGGALMAIATGLKLLLTALHLPPLYEGLVFSLNYASAFCAAYLLHYTIATKLPANTATALARAVQEDAGHRTRLAHFLSEWRVAARLQIAGLVGNVVVAGPLAFAGYAAFTALAHRPLVAAEKAHHIFHAQSALGPSVVFAALTGVFLWVSSLAGAAADNMARTSNLAERLATNVHVMRRLNVVHARALVDRIVPRVGGLTGNVVLGFLLGGVPAAFAIASLPVEIRHVTVSTSSVAIAIATGTGSASEIALAIVGVVLIGIVNVVVSFVLALQFALRSARGLRGSWATQALVRIGVERWLGRGAPAARTRHIRLNVPRRTNRPSPFFPR